VQVVASIVQKLSKKLQTA